MKEKIVTTILYLLSSQIENVECYPLCTEDFDCLHPGPSIKACLCNCPITSVNRDFLEIDFTACVHVLRKCHFYKMWFDVQIQDMAGEYVSSKDINIKVPQEGATTVIPMYELTNKFLINGQSYSSQVKYSMAHDKKYTVSMQPHCTICDDSCNFLDDKEIPAEMNEKQKQEVVKTDFPVPIILIFALTLIGFLLVSIMLSCRVKRQRDTNAEHATERCQINSIRSNALLQTSDDTNVTQL